MKAPLLALLSVAAFTFSAEGAAFLVTGGQTNVDLDDDTLASVGWSVTGATTTATAAAGFDVAYPILASSTFIGDTDPFSIGGGDIFHTGDVTLSNAAGSVTVGDFTITSGLEVVDTLTTGAALFTVSPTSVDVSTPGVLQIGANLLITDALSTVLVGDTSLTGVVAGTALVDATTIPEPSAGLLCLLGVAFVGLRRRNTRA